MLEKGLLAKAEFQEERKHRSFVLIRKITQLAPMASWPYPVRDVKYDGVIEYDELLQDHLLRGGFIWHSHVRG